MHVYENQRTGCSEIAVPTQKVSTNQQVQMAEQDQMSQGNLFEMEKGLSIQPRISITIASIC